MHGDPLSLKNNNIHSDDSEKGTDELLTHKVSPVSLSVPQHFVFRPIKPNKVRWSKEPYPCPIIEPQVPISTGAITKKHNFTRHPHISVVSETTTGVVPTTIQLSDTIVHRDARKFPRIKSEVRSTETEVGTPAQRKLRTGRARRRARSNSHLPMKPSPDYRLDDLSDLEDRIHTDGLDKVNMQHLIPRKHPDLRSRSQNAALGPAQQMQSGVTPPITYNPVQHTGWGTLGDVINQAQQVDLLRFTLLILALCCFLGIVVDLTSTVPFQGIYTMLITALTVVVALVTARELKEFSESISGSRHRLRDMTHKEMFVCYLYKTDRSFMTEDMRQFAYPVSRGPNLPRNKAIHINVTRQILRDPKTFHCTYQDDQTYGRRTYVDLCLQGVVTVPALLDTGSTSCVIDKSLLSEVEAKAGYMLPRVKSLTRLQGFMEDQNANNTGCVSMDIIIRNNVHDKQLILHSVPIFVVEGGSSRFILGQNVISQQCDVLGLTGSEAYVTLRQCEGFGKVPIQYLHDDTPSYDLEPVEDVCLQPKEACITTLTLKGCHGNPTDLDFKPMYLTDSLGNASDTHDSLDFPDTLQVKRGMGKVMLRNTTKSPLFFPAGNTLLKGTLIDTQDTTDVSPVVAAISNYQYLDPKNYGKCPCQIKTDGDVGFIADHHGYTYQGYTVRSVLEDRGLEPYNAGVYKDENYFYLVAGDRMNFEPLRDSPVEEIIRKWTFKNNTLFVCFAEHALLTDALLEFLQSLNKHVTVKLAEVNEKDYCQDCRQKSLSTLVRFKELKHTKRLNVIIPSQFGIKMESKKTQRLLTKLQNAETQKFLLTTGKYPADFYISGPHEASLYIHVPIKTAGQENTTTELLCYILAELSRVFPRATIQLHANVPHTHVYRKWILNAFSMARYFYYFPEVFVPDAVRRWNLESDKTEPVDIKRERCACSLCVGNTDKSNAYDFQPISTETWPAMTIEESLTPKAPKHTEVNASGTTLAKLVQVQQPHTVAAVDTNGGKGGKRGKGGNFTGSTRGSALTPSTYTSAGEEELGGNNNAFPEEVGENNNISRAAATAEELIEADDSATPAYARQVGKVKKRDVFEEYDDNSIAAEVNTLRGADLERDPQGNYTPLREVTMNDLLDPGPYKKEGGVRGQHPLPKERRRTVSIDKMDEYIDFTKVNSSKIIDALRLFLFTFRDVLQLEKEYDFSYIRVIAARLYPRPECDGLAFHSRPYPATNAMLEALNVFVAKKLAQGVFTHSNKSLTLHTYSAFLVVKSSDVRMANKVHVKSDVQKLDMPVEKKWRFVVDASAQQRRLLDTYNQTILRNLNHLSIGDHVNRGTNAQGRGIISTCDVSDAFGRCIVAADSRKYNGVALPGGVYQSVQMIQGSFLSPSIFVQSLNRALTLETKMSTLTYMDDLLINNAVVPSHDSKYPEGTHALLHHPTCHDLECNSCKYIYKDDYDLDRALIDREGANIDTFKPHDMDKFMSRLGELDKNKYLPIHEMAISYFSPGASLDKGQDWSDTDTKLKNCPKYEVDLTEDWSDDEIRNHFANLTSLFSDLRNAGISVSATKEKLQLFRSRLKYFGHWYSTSEVELSQDRKDYFDHFRTASTVKEARQFAGAINFISGFAADIPYLLRPLNCSLGMADKEPLNDLQKKSINVIIDLVQNISGLPLLPSDAQLVVFTDSSLLATGIVAGHYDTRDKFNPTIFYSKNFDACISRSTSAIEREFLGISMFLKLHPEATQRRKRTIFVTDSRGVHLLWNSEKINTLTSRVGRAVLFLKSQPLNIRIIHRPSTHAGVQISDALSRHLNKYYMTQDSQIQQQAARDLQDRQETTGPIEIDHNKLFPTELVKQDIPVENLDTLHDLYMRGFLTKAKKFSQDTFSDVVAQMHHNQFPDKHKEKVGSVVEMPMTPNSTQSHATAHNKHAAHSVTPNLGTQDIMNKHQWCMNTCGATEALDEYSKILDVGEEGIIHAVHAHLSGSDLALVSDKITTRPHTDKDKIIPITDTSHTAINARLIEMAYGKSPPTVKRNELKKELAPTSAAADKRGKAATTVDSVKRADERRLEGTIEKIASPEKIGFFQLPVPTRQMPLKQILDTRDRSIIDKSNAETHPTPLINGGKVLAATRNYSKSKGASMHNKITRDHTIVQFTRDDHNNVQGQNNQSPIDQKVVGHNQPIDRESHAYVESAPKMKTARAPAKLATQTLPCAKTPTARLLESNKSPPHTYYSARESRERPAGFVSAGTKSTRFIPQINALSLKQINEPKSNDSPARQTSADNDSTHTPHMQPNASEAEPLMQASPVFLQATSGRQIELRKSTPTMRGNNSTDNISGSSKDASTSTEECYMTLIGAKTRSAADLSRPPSKSETYRREPNRHNNFRETMLDADIRPGFGPFQLPSAGMPAYSQQRLKQEMGINDAYYEPGILSLQSRRPRIDTARHKRHPPRLNTVLDNHADQAAWLWIVIKQKAQDLNQLELKRRVCNLRDITRINWCKRDLAECVQEFRDVVGMPIEEPINYYSSHTYATLREAMHNPAYGFVRLDSSGPKYNDSVENNDSPVRSHQILDVENMKIFLELPFYRNLLQPVEDRLVGKYEKERKIELTCDVGRLCPTRDLGWRSRCYRPKDF